jgi:hypothetical protein
MYSVILNMLNIDWGQNETRYQVISSNRINVLDFSSVGVSV